jgi:hypothetical protein
LSTRNVESKLLEFDRELVGESFRFFEVCFGKIFVYSVEDLYSLIFDKILLVVGYEEGKLLRLVVK